MKDKNSHSKIYFSYVLFIFIFLATFFLIALSIDVLVKPDTVTVTNLDNQIVEEYELDYQAAVEPCILYPDGGIIIPRKNIIIKITKNIIFNVKAVIKADKPVHLEGNRFFSCLLIAEDLWEKEFLLAADEKYSEKSSQHYIFNESYQLDLRELLSYIEKAEKELDTKPNRYLLKLIPYFSGKILYNDTSHQIISIPHMEFEIIYGQIRPLADSQSNNKIAYSGTIPLYSNKILKQDYSLLGLQIPILTAKFILPLLTVLLFGILVMLTYSIIKKKLALKVNEAEVINRKYKKRIIHLADEISMSGKSVLSAASFRDLLNIANEKGLNILYVKKEGYSIYYVADGSFLYCYYSNDSPSAMECDNTEA